MKKADAVIQTVLSGLALVSLILTLTLTAGFIMAFFYVQGIIGLWQLFRSVLLLFNYSDQTFHTQKTLMSYWKYIHVYALGLFVLFALKFIFPTIIFFFSGWLIIIYYYVFTLREASGKLPPRRTFMDLMS